ncbi:sensor histidine kinase [Hymenobacter tenuis]
MNVRSVTPLGTYVQQHREAVFTLDSLGTITTVSEPFARLVNQEVAALRGRPLAELVAASNPGAIELLLQHSQRGEVLTLELVLPSSAGQPLEVELTTVPFLLHGELAGISGEARPRNQQDSSSESLKEREEQLSVIFSSVADVIFVLQVEPGNAYRFTYINKAFETVTGLPYARVVGRPVQEIIPEPSYSLVRSQYQQAAETRQLVSWLETTEYPTGSLIGEVSVAPVFDSQDTCIQLVGTVHDLTAQKRVEEDLRVSNERFAYALKATTDALYDWNMQSDQLVWGEGFNTLFGYDVVQNPPTFQQWATYIHPDDADHVLQDLQKATATDSGDTWQQEYRFRRADGSWANVFDRSCIIRNETGTAIRMIGAMQDITLRRQTEVKQRVLMQELNRQNADLQQFTYIVSHNLRAPLANAIGFTDLLARVDKTGEVFQKSLQHLQTSLAQLDTIISDVNTILSIRDKTEAGRPEPVFLDQVCSKVMETFRPALAECGGTIECAIPNTIQVVGYRAYFNSIFFNLLANAIKYRSDKRPLQVEVKASYTPQGVQVQIQDNGTGLDLKQVGNDVFQLYKRFHKVPTGRGIGLFLVKSHVEAMGGHIEISSQVNQGTCFTLSFG